MFEKRTLNFRLLGRFLRRNFLLYAAVVMGASGFNVQSILGLLVGVRTSCRTLLVHFW